MGQLLILFIRLSVALGIVQAVSLVCVDKRPGYSAVINDSAHKRRLLD